MKRTLFIAIATGCLLTFGLVQSRTVSADEHTQSMHHGDHDSMMSEGHHMMPMGETTAAQNGFSKKPAVGTKAKCPVTGNVFTVTKDTQLSKYKGKFYAFCCPGCKPQFDKEPTKYLK